MMAPVLERRQARVEGELAEVAGVRHSVGEWVRGWGLEALAEDVELVASELTTNAILHAGGSVDVVVERRCGGVRVVHDRRPDVVPSPAVPPPLRSGGDDELDRLARSLLESTTTGRGLMLVEAFSDTWGVDVGGSTKGVWAEVGTGRPAATGTRDPASTTEGDGRVTVQLRDVPVRLVLLSSANLDDLVRELQTTEFDAVAPAELALLGEHLARSTSAQREPLRAAARAALEEREHTLDVDIAVPPGQVAVLRRFVGLTAQVEAFCRAGVLLSGPPTPEVTAFRCWYVEEVTRQVGGHAASPCPFSA